MSRQAAGKGHLRPSKHVHVHLFATTPDLHSTGMGGFICFTAFPGDLNRIGLVTYTLVKNESPQNRNPAGRHSMI